jgi:hypothetical protein
MTSESIPAVLVPPKPYSGISMERALKQIKELLEQSWSEVMTHEDADKLQASIDDVDVMLMCIKR